MPLTDSQFKLLKLWMIAEARSLTDNSIEQEITRHNAESDAYSALVHGLYTEES